MIAGTPLPSSPTSLRLRAEKRHLRRGVGAVAQLILQPLDADGVEAAIGAEARQQETGQPFRRLRKNKEGIAHRRRHEPFMPGDGIEAVAAERARPR